MINQYSLTHPDHPLHTEGEDGISLFLGMFRVSINPYKLILAGVDHMGRERLLMSLRQIEYIQYYIHTMRLAERGWVEYLTARTAALQAGDVPPEPPKEVDEGIWIPLPGSIRWRSEFVSMVRTSGCHQYS
jgi:hypothetical protein